MSNYSFLLFVVQLGKGGWRKPLTMGNQQSETQAEFDARAGLSEPMDFKGGPQPYNLQAHHTDGPSKVQSKIMKLRSRLFNMFMRLQRLLTRLDFSQ